MDLDQELELSKDVQKLLLPSTRPVIDGYAFFDYFQAARQIGGEYYDYVRLADGRLVVVVADVAGLGIAAAMLLAKFSGEVRFYLASESDPAAAVTQLNERICQFDVNRFATLLTVSLDRDTHEVTIVSAGHLPLIHRHLDGSLNLPGEGAAGIPIGVVNDAEYIATKLTLQPGESLTLFTKGFPDALNATGEMLTVNRMCEIVAATNGDPTEIGNALLTQVRQHLGSRPQDDDMCLISFGRVPTAQVPHKGT